MALAFECLQNSPPGFTFKISYLAPLPQVLRRVWSYHWRLWAIPDAKEMLLEAGFDAVHVWLRPMRQQGGAAVPASSAQPKGKCGGGRKGNRRQGGSGRRAGQ